MDHLRIFFEFGITEINVAGMAYFPELGDNGSVKQKILFVSHCVLNTAAKVVMYNEKEMAEEEALRRRFVRAAIDADIQLIQLPCPEFTLYGSRRWGHASDQFDNPFFRRHSRRLLEGPLDEAAAYHADSERFELLGFVGIDGSPSCGVDYTCVGPWGGNPVGRGDLPSVLSNISLVRKAGVFFDELVKSLAERGLAMTCAGLFAPEPGKVMSLLR
jgi:predicted secreted protein